MIDSADRFKWMALRFGVLEELSNVAAGIEERAVQLDVLGTALERIAQGENDVSVGDVLRQAAADARASAEAGRDSSTKVATAIDSALARLSNNATLTPDDVTAITADLEAAKAANEAGVAADTAATGVADSIDPDTAGTGVVDDGTGGVTETPPV